MIYFETGRAVKGLDYDTKGRLFEAIMEYAEFGILPEFDGVLSAIWPFVADKIDRDNDRYEAIREARAEAGRRGGETRIKNLKQMQASEANASSDKQIKPTVTAPTPGTITTPETEKGDARGERENRRVSTLFAFEQEEPLTEEQRRRKAIEQVMNYPQKPK